MRLSDLVSFDRTRYFEGAVQLGWLDSAPERAELAAQSYVFHGPAFHGVADGERDAVHGSEARLKDTATFVEEMVRLTVGFAESAPVKRGRGRPPKDAASEPASNAVPTDHNPFGLAIAGYGTGKSHLAVTLTRLLEGDDEIRDTIIARLDEAAPGAGDRIKTLLDAAAGPVLVVALDGMGNFNLASAIYGQVVERLCAVDADLTAIDNLSPRFATAEKFATRNFPKNQAAYRGAFGASCSLKDVTERLQRRDEAAFQAVSAIAEAELGTPIPLDGNESPEVLITTVCEHYIGPGKPFAGMLILFDEFGRYLEFAAEKPQFAGDAALQQVFQGVQTAGKWGKCYFLGLIQFDLKTYMAQLQKRDAQNLMRFVPRYDQATKTLLSSNQETLFANLLTRRDPKQLTQLLATTEAEAHWKATQTAMAAALPGFARWEVWSSPARYRKVIVEGCYPLHPTTVWFLARLDGVVQNRSALSFVAEAIADAAEKDVETASGVPFCLYPVDLLLGSMAGELLEADRRKFGTVVETFAEIRQRHQGRWETSQERVVAAVAIAQLMKGSFKTEPQARLFLSALTGLEPAETTEALNTVIANFALVAWNADLKQYDLIRDGVPRSAFASLIKQKAARLDPERALAYFSTFGESACELAAPPSTFADDKVIHSPDWRYEIKTSSPGELRRDLEAAVREARSVIGPDDARGRLLYVLVPQETAPDSLIEQFQAIAIKAMPEPLPVFGVLLADSKGEIVQALAELCVIEKLLSNDERAKYAAFIEPEIRDLRKRLAALAADAVAQKHHVLPTGAPEASRLSQIATKLFEWVYPAIMRFPFDGFSRAVGGRTKDIAELTKLLANGGLTANWIASQKMAEKNRVTTLLQSAWGVLGDDLAVRREPIYKPLKTLLDAWNQRLVAEGNVNLGDLFGTLLAPPYGMNTASAGLVMGIFIGAKQPGKSLTIGKRPVDVNGWLEHGMGKGNTFDLAKLRETTASYVSASDSEAWQAIATDWFTTKAHRQVIALDKRTDALRFKVPMPTELEGPLQAFKERVEGAKSAMASFDDKLNKWSSAAHAGRDGKNLSKVLDALSLAKKWVLDAERGDEWDATDRDEVERFIGQYDHQIDKHFDDWLSDFWPPGPAEIGDFQTRVKVYVRALDQLGKSSLKERLQRHGTAIETRMAERTAAEIELNSARAYLGSSSGSEATASSLLARWRADGQGHVSNLQRRTSYFSDTSEVLSRIEARVADLGKLLETRQATLNQLAETDNISSRESLIAALHQAKKLRDVIDTDPDKAFCHDMFAQLDIAVRDQEAFWLFEGLDGALRAFAQKRAAERQAELEKQGREPYWDFEPMYQALAEERIAMQRKIAMDWLDSLAPDVVPIAGWTVVVCQSTMAKLAKRPPAVAAVEEATERADSLMATIQRRLAVADEEERAEKAARWMQTHVLGEAEINELGASAAKQALRSLEAAPVYLSQVDLVQVEIARARLNAHLDTIDFSELAKRVSRLSPENRGKLIPLIELPQAGGVGNSPPGLAIGAGVEPRSQSQSGRQRSSSAPGVTAGADLAAIYMDCHAGTPVDPRVAAAVNEAMTAAPGNPSSADHAFGERAAARIAIATEHVADLLDAHPSEVIFTSGATEALNLALRGLADTWSGTRRRVAVSPLEHPAVLETCRDLARRGMIEVDWLAITPQGHIPLADIERACTDGAALVVAMAANNEIGTITDVAAIARICNEHSIPLLCDAAQAVGKVPLAFGEWGIDMLALSAHKLYGPPGVGALIVRRGLKIAPLITGGAQQRGLRAGTLNMPGIVGLGEACRLRKAHMAVDEVAIAQLRDTLEQRLRAALPNLTVTGDPAARLSGNLHVTLPDLDSSIVMARLRDHLAISTGSACASGIVAPSHVLSAIGVPESRIHGAFRFGLGKDNTRDEVNTATGLFVRAVA